MVNPTAQKVFEEIENFEERLNFSMKRISQIGLVEWKKEILEAQKVEAFLLQGKRKEAEELEADRRSNVIRRQIVQEAIDNENFVRLVLERHAQAEEDVRVSKVWDKLAKNFTRFCCQKLLFT